MTDLRQFLDRLLPEALDALRQMVAINSFTHNPEGVNRVGDLTESLFTPMGFEAQRPQAILCITDGEALTGNTPPLGRHLILTRHGRSKRRIGLVGHLDTVFTSDEEAANDFRWREVGDRIYGPGTVDIKGGNVLIWMVLRAIQAQKPELFDAVTWLVMLNAAEEGLSSDFGSLERRLLRADAVGNLIFEGAGDVNGRHRIVSHRKGSLGLHVVAEGRAAHAGGNHEQGVNAIVQLSHVIDRLAKLTDYERGLTCNVGVVRGGVTVNRVPERAEALVEMRAFDPAVLQSALDQALSMNSLSTVSSASDGYPARVRVTCRKQPPTWPKNPASQHLADIWTDIGTLVGRDMIVDGRGGLSDGNFTFDLTPTLDGLGPVGGNFHCPVRSDDGSADQEFVLPGSFVPCAMTNVLGIERMISEAGLI